MSSKVYLVDLGLIQYNPVDGLASRFDIRYLQRRLSIYAAHSGWPTCKYCGDQILHNPNKYIWAKKGSKSMYFQPKQFFTRATCGNCRQSPKGVGAAITEGTSA